MEREVGGGIGMGKTCKLKDVSMYDKIHYKLKKKKKSLMLGKIEGKGKRGQQRMGWLNGVIVSIDMSLSKLQEIVKDREACHAVVHGFMKSHT